MHRGDLVTVAALCDYGKPRPAVVIQGDAINQADPDSVILVLMTGTLRDAPLLRLTVDPTPANGLQKLSQVMVDKLVTTGKRSETRSGGSRIRTCWNSTGCWPWSSAWPDVACFSALPLLGKAVATTYPLQMVPSKFTRSHALRLCKYSKIWPKSPDT